MVGVPDKYDQNFPVEEEGVVTIWNPRPQVRVTAFCPLPQRFWVRAPEEAWECGVLLEEQGNLRSAEDGMEGSAGFLQLRPVTCTPATRVRAPWRQRTNNRGMQVSCEGQGRAWALSRGEGAPGP